MTLDSKLIFISGLSIPSKECRSHLSTLIGSLLGSDLACWFGLITRYKSWDRKWKLPFWMKTPKEIYIIA
jgi:hypothetical protein